VERGGALVALGDEFLEIFVLRRAHRAQPKIMDDQQHNSGELVELLGKGIGGACGVQGGQQLGVGGEQDLMALSERAAAQCPGRVALAGAGESQDKRKEAYDLLAPIYNWFTEGFGTKDLKETKTLLAQLNA
jgi:hypothetical protein